jgi:16S rRNA processing protein RimM
VIRLDRAVERGAPLAVPGAALPATGEGEYYAFQLVGLAVVEEGGRALGRVRAVHPGPANDALDLGGGLLLPLVAACVLRVDLEARRILVARGFSDPA